MDAKATGNFIREQRKIKGLTQKDLAEILRCTDKAVSRWETGSGFPDVTFLIPLSKALEVTVNEILLGEKIEKEELIERSDSLLVETIKSNHCRISKLQFIIYVLICFISAFFMYVTPMTAEPSDTMGVVFLIMMAVPALSLILGFLNIQLKYKLIFPIINVALFAPTVFIFTMYSRDTEVLFLYSAIFLASSAVGVLTSHALKIAVKFIVKGYLDKKAR